MQGKALAARNIQNRTYLKDSLCLCDLAYPITYSLATPDHVGDPTLEGKLFQAVTGHRRGGPGAPGRAHLQYAAVYLPARGLAYPRGRLSAGL